MTESKIYKVAPTDLTFGMNCPCCLRAKVVDGYRAPRQPFPSVFGGLDRLMSNAYGGRTVHDVFGKDSELPDGVLGTKQVSVKSAPVKLSETISIVISGRLDCLVSHASTKVSVIDNKIGSSKTMGIYERQLGAYSQALALPAKGSPVEVVAIAMVCNMPGSSSQLHAGRWSGADKKTGNAEEGLYNNFSFREYIDWKPMDWDKWNAFLKEELLPILENPQKPSPDCVQCSHRELGKIRAQNKKTQ